MADRSTAQEVVQIGPEATLGTKVAATKVLTSLMVDMGSQATFDTITSQGQEFDGDVALRQEWVTGSISGKPTYTELGYILANKFGPPVIASLGGSPTAYSWTWTRNGLTWPTPSGWTIERGVVNSGDPIDVATYGLINNLTLGFNRTAEQSVGGSMIGRAFDVSTYYMSGNDRETLTAAASPPTAGTFTLTVAAQTTAAIAFGATPATVQAALELLSTVGAGNVKVSLGAFGPTLATANSTYIIEYIGALGQTTVVTTGTFTTLTPSASVAISATTVGAPLTALDNVPILAGQVDVFVDPTSGAIGTTKFLRDFVYAYESGEQLDTFWPLNTALSSFGGHTYKKADAKITLTVGNDPTGRALYAAMRASTSEFIRLQALGGVISGANNYRLRIDTHAKVYGPPARGDQNGLSTLVVPMRIVRNTAWAKAMVVELITSVAAPT